MSTSTRDFAELDRQIDNAVRHAEAKKNPNTQVEGRDWDQDVWIAMPNAYSDGTPIPQGDTCTAYGCLAGNTVLDAGYLATSGGRIVGFLPNTPAEERATELVANSGYADTVQALHLHVEYEAGDLLGLDSDEAEVLFRSVNTADDLRELQRMLHAGEDITDYEPLGYRDNTSEEEE